MMKRLLLFLCGGLLLFQGMPVMADTDLKAGIRHNLSFEEAKQAAFQGRVDHIDTSIIPTVDPDFAENQHCVANGGCILETRAITVFEHGKYAVSPRYSVIVPHYLANGKLYAIDFNSSPVYSDPASGIKRPQKTWKYDTHGNLRGVAISISDEESFVFLPDGSLGAHWVGDQCLTAEGLSCGTQKTLYRHHWDEPYSSVSN